MYHKTKSFKDEYLDFMRKFQIDCKEEYLFDWLDE